MYNARHANLLTPIRRLFFVKVKICAANGYIYAAA